MDGSLFVTRVCRAHLQEQGEDTPKSGKAKNRKPFKEAEATAQKREMEGPHETGGFGEGADSGLERRC